MTEATPTNTVQKPTPVEVTRRPSPASSAAGFAAQFVLPLKGISARRVWAARIIAGTADFIQWVLIPTGTPLGVVSPVNDAIDVVVMIVMISILGWHIAFLPSFIVEEIPVLNMAPTWTIAVVYATWGAASEPAASNDSPAAPAVTPADGGAASGR